MEERKRRSDTHSARITNQRDSRSRKLPEGSQKRENENDNDVIASPRASSIMVECVDETDENTTAEASKKEVRNGNGHSSKTVETHERDGNKDRRESRRESDMREKYRTRISRPYAHDMNRSWERKVEKTLSAREVARKARIERDRKMNRDKNQNSPKNRGDNCRTKEDQHGSSHRKTEDHSRHSEKPREKRNREEKSTIKESGKKNGHDISKRNVKTVEKEDKNLEEVDCCEEEEISNGNSDSNARGDIKKSCDESKNDEKCLQVYGDEELDYEDDFGLDDDDINIEVMKKAATAVDNDVVSHFVDDEDVTESSFEKTTTDGRKSKIEGENEVTKSKLEEKENPKEVEDLSRKSKSPRGKDHNDISRKERRDRDRSRDRKRTHSKSKSPISRGQEKRRAEDNRGSHSPAHRIQTNRDGMERNVGKFNEKIYGSGHIASTPGTLYGAEVSRKDMWRHLEEIDKKMADLEKEKRKMLHNSTQRLDGRRREPIRERRERSIDRKRNDIIRMRRSRSPIRRRPSPRLRPGDRVVASYKNGVIRK